jgi:hypothetical protein
MYMSPPKCSCAKLRIAIASGRYRPKIASGRLSRGSRSVIGALFLQRVKHNITFLTAKVQVAERALGDAKGQLQKI